MTGRMVEHVTQTTTQWFGLRSDAKHNLKEVDTDI